MATLKDIAYTYDDLLEGRRYWQRMKSIEEQAAREVFIRNIFGHQRMLFRKNA